MTYILPVAACGLIIVGYLALGVHYFHEAQQLARQRTEPAREVSQPLSKAPKPHEQ